MPPVPEDLTKWDDASLLRAFEQKVELHKTLVGSLYPNMLMDEIEAVGQECIRRHTYHPNWWREKGIVESSWTDSHGLVHAWNHRDLGQSRVPDDPAKAITCFECASK